MQFDKIFLMQAIPEIEILYYKLQDYSNFNISIDSRTAKMGDIFIALEGNRFDAHNFIEEAIDKKISGLIINKSKKDILKKIDKNILENLLVALVPETKEALFLLAKNWRGLFKNIKIIGITGSVGKTSTKEFLNNILKLSGINYISSLANQNSQIGVCLNILRIRNEHKVAVIEMGISKRGEMARLVDIVKPDIACITYIGHAHMEGLGSINDIASEKKEIFKYFNESNIGIINGDQPIISNISYKHPIIRFGYKTTNQIQARKVHSKNLETNFNLKIYKDTYNITLNTSHYGQILNTLAATAIAYLLNIDNNIIIKGLKEPLKIESRFQRYNIKNSNNILIDDCYNASPESVKAALVAFEKIKFNGKKIAVLGDMLELGVNSQFWHRQLGRFLRKVPSLNYLVLVGNLVNAAKNTVPVGLKFDIAKNWAEAFDYIKKNMDNKSIILLKGSRAIALENIAKKLKE